jgi:galactokinase
MIEQFRSLYGEDRQPRFYRAPGRVNLIGEHTDYNLGFVLPIALDMACYVACAPSSDGRIHVHSLDRREGFDFDVDLRNAIPRKNWTDYVIGVAQGLARRGVEIRPMNLALHSDVPEGSGLSSSAALEVSSAFAFLDGRDFDKLEIAKLCQQAEIEFVGMPCGIMDQYISVFGRKNRAIEIDCRSLQHRAVPLPENVAILAVNSMVKHELASSAYADRVNECRAAVDQIRRVHPQVASLRDAKVEYLDEAGLTGTLKKRARHIITENERVEQFLVASERGDLAEMGKLFVGSHRSMQFDYEITCEEIDFLVDAALSIDGVFGARMTGGGFGGCTVNLVEPEKAPAFERAIKQAYQARWGVDPPVFRCVPSEGAGQLPGRE